MKWDPYVLFKNEEISSFWKNHFSETKRILFIMGKGFDVRMNNVISKLVTEINSTNIKCLLVEYHEGENTPSLEYKETIDENISNLKKLLINHELESLQIKNLKDNRRRGMDVSNKINNYAEIYEYSDVIVDISALPRGIYFPLVGTLIKKLNNNINLFVTVSENIEIDNCINEENTEEKISFVHGFGGGIELESDHKPLIFFPVLGEKKINDLNKLYNHLNPKEICPILPFPSKHIRRSDSLIIDFHKTLFDELRVESQNIIYVPEQNPFEMYRILTNTFNNYQKSLSVLGGCNAAVTVFSSKLLTLGVLLAAIEQEQGIAVYNIDSSGYKIENDDVEKLKQLNNNSETFLMWLNGEAYE